MNIKVLKDYIEDSKIFGFDPNWEDLKERNIITKKLQNLEIDFVKAIK